MTQSKNRAFVRFRFDFLVPVLEVRTDENSRLLILMEMSDRGSLREFIPQLQTMLASYKRHEILKIFQNILLALTYLSKTRSIVHRNIKPSKILIFSDGNGQNVYKLNASDGYSRMLNESSAASTLVGTKMYMAPEIHDGKKYDHRCDIFSSGMVLLECELGQYPFSDDELLRNYYLQSHMRGGLIDKKIRRNERHT